MRLTQAALPFKLVPENPAGATRSTCVPAPWADTGTRLPQTKPTKEKNQKIQPGTTGRRSLCRREPPSSISIRFLSVHVSPSQYLSPCLCLPHAPFPASRKAYIKSTLTCHSRLAGPMPQRCLLYASFPPFFSPHAMPEALSRSDVRHRLAFGPSYAGLQVLLLVGAMWCTCPIARRQVHPPKAEPQSPFCVWIVRLLSALGSTLAHLSPRPSLIVSPPPPPDRTARGPNLGRRTTRLFPLLPIAMVPPPNTHTPPLLPSFPAPSPTLQPPTIPKPPIPCTPIRSHTHA